MAFSTSFLPSDSGATLTGQRGAAAGTDMISMGVTNDATDRFVVNADGKMEWGDGTAALDTNLYRAAAGSLKIDGGLRLDAELRARFGGVEVTALGAVGPAGQSGVLFGSGADTNLYRSAANKLTTDDGLVLNNGALAGGANAAATIYFGSGAPNNANGVNGDIYLRTDGGALTTMYQRRAGAWTGIV